MKVFKAVTLAFIFSFLFKPATAFSDMYKAFSIKNAQKMIMSNSPGIEFRDTMPQVYTLSGITKIAGLVYDSDKQDIIIVGTEDKRFPVLSVDDLISALKARLVLGQWPLVSLEPDNTTDKDNQLTVRFKGELANTSFGKALLDADYALKRIVLGMHYTKVDGLKSYWDFGMEMVKENPENMKNIKTGLWFFPVIAKVFISDNVVEIGRVNLEVFAGGSNRSIYQKIHGGKKITVEDKSAIEFSVNLSSKFHELVNKYPVFARLYDFSCFVALATAIDDIGLEASVNWWMNNYHLKSVETPSRIKVLKREEKYKFEKDGAIHRGHRRLSGGIRIVAITRQIKGSNAYLLKDKVLQSRPNPDMLSWKFTVDKWVILL